uniref:Dihydrolipoamide acetyltransferase component of pyruvate dehydrogenase complex n=1 Tax=Heterorhabditis bacteriophora TaxID=37862 RepID=A0A1I7WKB3_HETBA
MEQTTRQFLPHHCAAALMSITYLSYSTMQYVFLWSSSSCQISERGLQKFKLKNVSQFDNLCEVQSDKASVTITSRYDGVIKNLLYKVDDIARVGQPLVEIEVAGEVENESNSNEQTSQSAVNKPHSSDTSSLNNNSTTEHKQGKVLATPAVRRIAMENQVKWAPTIISPSFSCGFLFLRVYLILDHSFGSSNVRASPPSGNLPQSSKTLSSTINSSILISIGIIVQMMAVAYKIPFFRSIFEIASELQRIHENAKKQQIAREDLIEGTFTLSNIGAIGGTYANPVIFPPQVAIGAIGKMERLPRFDKHDNACFIFIFPIEPSALKKFRTINTIFQVINFELYVNVDPQYFYFTMYFYYSLWILTYRFHYRWKFYLEHPFAMLAHLK